METTLLKARIAELENVERLCRVYLKAHNDAMMFASRKEGKEKREAADTAYKTYKAAHTKAFEGVDFCESTKTN